MRMAYSPLLIVEMTLDATELIRLLETSESSSLSERKVVLNSIIAAPIPRLAARIFAKAIALRAKSSSSSSVVGDSFEVSSSTSRVVSTA